MLMWQRIRYGGLAVLVAAIVAGAVRFCSDEYAVSVVAGPRVALTYRSPSPLDDILSQAESVCFIGDSLTAGSENGGFPWYTPMMKLYPQVQVSSLASGGLTSSQLRDKLRDKVWNIPKSSCYIIAIGTNDVRYRNASCGAVTAEDYINNLREIESFLPPPPPHTQIKCVRVIYIAPWESIPQDPIPPMDAKEKEKLLHAYSAALADYCRETGALFINPNPCLHPILREKKLRQRFLMDHIHPGPSDGCLLYSSAVYSASSYY